MFNVSKFSFNFNKTLQIIFGVTIIENTHTHMQCCLTSRVYPSLLLLLYPSGSGLGCQGY